MRKILLRNSFQCQSLSVDNFYFGAVLEHGFLVCNFRVLISHFEASFSSFQQNIWSYSSDNTQYTMYNPEQLKAFYPKSKREFVITICLSVLSVIVITYFMVALYKCMCSRNYSRWRHSLARYKARRQRAKGTYYKQIKDAVPIILTGHNQVSAD